MVGFYIKMDLSANWLIMHPRLFKEDDLVVKHWQSCRHKRRLHHLIVYRHKCPIWLQNMLQTAVQRFFGSLLFLRKGILILFNVWIMQAIFIVEHSINYQLNQWEEQNAIVWFKIKGWNHLDEWMCVYFLLLSYPASGNKVIFIKMSWISGKSV